MGCLCYPIEDTRLAIFVSRRKDASDDVPRTYQGIRALPLRGHGHVVTRVGASQQPISKLAFVALR